MAAGERAVEEPVVREDSEEAVASSCVVCFVGHGELRFDWQHSGFCCFSLLLFNVVLLNEQH